MPELVPIPASWFSVGTRLEPKPVQGGGFCEVPQCLRLSFANVNTGEGRRLICLSHYELALEAVRKPPTQ
jgi:hypothetical protein